MYDIPNPPTGYTHYIQQRDRELKKMAAMRAHNIGFYKPSHWHGRCQVICFCWCGSSLLDVHFELGIITSCGLSIMVDVVVGFVLLVLPQDILARHSGDDRQVSWGGLGDGGITPVQEELTVVDDPSPSGGGRE